MAKKREKRERTNLPKDEIGVIRISAALTQPAEVRKGSGVINDTPAKAIYVGPEKSSEEEENLSYNWPLGDDSYCELCGDSNNAVIFEDYGDGDYQLYIGVGCHGGESYQLSELKDLLSHIKGYEYYNKELENEIKVAISKFKERYNIK